MSHDEVVVNAMLMAQRTQGEARTDRFLIIELFAKRRPNYSHDEVLRLTRSADEEIAAAVDAGDLQPHRKPGGPLLYAWDEVATFALRRWTPRMVCSLLGSAHAAAIPYLNRTAVIEIELPLYQIRMLHVLANTDSDGFRASLNVSDIIELQLLDLADVADSDEMEDAIPGFRAARRYPYFVTYEDDEDTRYCCFCGVAVEEKGREVCNECKERHQPR